MRWLFISAVCMSLMGYTEFSSNLNIVRIEPENVDWNAAYSNLLRIHVSEKGVVNYKGLKTKKNQLASYLEFMATNKPSESAERSEKLAYWINLYNASTLNLILDNYPIASIMKINGGKAWDLKIVKVGDETFTLNQIEHEKIRAVFSEPRIHFAVNCAAMSCPKLLNTAYTANNLESQLDAQTKYFIDGSGKNRIGGETLSLSKIFDWYKNDFTETGTLIDFIRKYSDKAIEENPKVIFLEYNWSLNE